MIRSRYIEALLRSPKTIGKPLNPFPVQWHASRYYSSIIKQKFLQGEQISPTRRFVPEFDQIAGRWQWVIEQGPSRPTDELLLDFADLIVFVLSHWDDDHDFRSFCPFVTLLEDALAAAKRLERKSDEKIILKNLTKMREELRKANELHQRLAASQSPPPAENTDEG